MESGGGLHASHSPNSHHAGRGVHTLPAKGAGWINEMPGKLLSRHRTKADVVMAGRSFARQAHVEHTIHTTDGVIAENNCPPKDGW